MPYPVVHFEVAGRDAAALKDFYGQLFEWNVAPYPGMSDYYGVDTQSEGVGIGGGIMQAPPEVPPYVTFYVGVPDLAAHLAKVEQLGGSTVVPPTQIPGMGAFAIFTDPEGNAIGLWANEGGPDA